MAENNRYLAVLITASSTTEAEGIAQALVREDLAACVNVVEKCISVYRWKGEIVKDSEILLIAKTSNRLFPELSRRVKDLHSYDVPEIIGMPLEAIDEGYLAFLESTLSNKK